jgi:hypothetical protein
VQIATVQKRNQFPYVKAEYGEATCLLLNWRISPGQQIGCIQQHVHCHTAVPAVCSGNVGVASLFLKDKSYVPSLEAMWLACVGHATVLGTHAMLTSIE